MLTEVHVPDDVSSAARLVAAGATVLGGGTSLMPRLNDYSSAPTELVSLRRAGLRGVEVEGPRVTLGAATTLAQLEADPRLAILDPVVRSIASVPVRHLATVGGNLFAPQPHGDLAVALVALGADVELYDDAEGRRLSLEELVTGEPDPHALVTSVAFDLPDPGAFTYVKAARRRFNSVSIVTVAATISESDGVVSQARIALGGVGPRVVRAHAVEAALLGHRLDADVVASAAEAGLAEIAPVDDAYASAWYRRRVFPVHLRRALLGA